MTAWAGERCAPTDAAEKGVLAQSSIGVKERLPDDQGRTREENKLIKEAYVKLSTIQWQWVEVLSSWQRNALLPLVNFVSLCSPDHPLRDLKEPGMCFYNVTESDGRTRLSMSLRQLEYLQYYIHEMRLADPVWVQHITALGDIDQPHESDKDVGPPHYPEGEEWLRLPNAFVYGDQVQSVEKIFFNDSKALKKYHEKQRRENKKVPVIKMTPVNPELEDDLAKALSDNLTPGPGLRRGPAKTSRGWHTGGSDDRGNQTAGDIGQADEEEADDQVEVELVQEGADQVATAAAAEDEAAAGQPFKNFTSMYYEEAQKALLISTLGGLFEAQLKPGSESHSGSLTKESHSGSLSNDPTVGRGLFISIRMVTWEADRTTVLEVGWSAIWWQERMEGGLVAEEEDRFEECREVGHIIVQDHLLEKRNGNWKPDRRSEFRFGNSLPIASTDVPKTVEARLSDLYQRAGGGPTYIVLHSADGDDCDLARIGLKTKDWYRQLKPTSWDVPCYASREGSGKTFVIDTAMLFAAVEFDPKNGPSPIKSKTPLDHIAWAIFDEGDIRKPDFFGNAGNDAFYNLEVCLACSLRHVCPSLDDLRVKIHRLQGEGPPSSKTAARDVGESEGDTAATDDVPADNDRDDDEESVWSEEELIKGTYAAGPDGEIVQLA